MNIFFHREWRETLGVLAGEGGFAVYKETSLLARLRRVAKYGVNSVSHFLKGSRSECAAKVLVYAVGANQSRLRSRYGVQYFGSDALFVDHPKLGGVRDRIGAPCIGFSELMRHLYLLSIYLVRGKKRDLSLFFLAYQKSMEAYVNSCMAGVREFYCFNDQIYECSSLILSLRRKGECKSVVIQHGLILRHQYYFPVNADEFWAWGRLSGRNYSNRYRLGLGGFVIKGRFPSDLEYWKSARSGCLEEGASILIAPSYDISEVARLLELTKAAVGSVCKIYLKPHPSTKGMVEVRGLCRKYGVELVPKEREMGDLALEMDAMVTSFSTSVIDFLILKKLVFVEKFHVIDDFPSPDYCYSLSEISRMAVDSCLGADRRLGAERFLAEAIGLNG